MGDTASPHKILVIAPLFPPYWQFGGIVRSADAVVCELTAKFHVHVIASALDDRWVKYQYRNLDKNVVEVSYLPSRPPFHFSLRLIICILAAMKTCQAVYINGLWTWPGLVASAFSKACGKQLILAPRGMLLPPALVKKRGQKKLLAYFMKLLIDRPTSSLHWTSELEKDQSKHNFLRCNHFVSPNVIVENDFWSPIETPPTDNVLRIVYMGRIDPIKNLEILLSALVVARTAGLAFELKIVGGGDSEYVASLQAFVHTNDLGKQVMFSGHLDGVARRKMIDDAHLLVLISKSENFGMAVAEALCRGRAVLLSQGVAIREYIEVADFCWVAEANEQDVSEKLIDVARAVHRPDFSPTWQAARMAAEKCFAPNKEQGIVDAFSSG